MTLALLLLLAALGFFLAATRQIKQPERLLIWLIGAAFLAWSGAQVIAAPGHYGLMRAFVDAWNGSTLVSVFLRNADSITQFVPQLLDVFIVLGGFLGLVVLISFTPDDTIERMARPALLILMGAILGGVGALAVVAVGLGGQIKPRTHLGFVSADDVYDGDTFRMGEVSLRLFGIDAPELHQICRGVENCGERARAHVIVLVDGALVQCDSKESRGGLTMESFGRPLVKCWVRRNGVRPFDLGERMIADGYAVAYKGDETFGYSAAETIGAQSALMGGCMLRPDLWRNDNAARRAFEDGDDLPADELRGSGCRGRAPLELDGAPTHGPVGAAPTEAPVSPLAPPQTPRAEGP